MIAVDVARDRRANATRCRERRARTSSLIRRPPALALALALAPRAPPRGAPRASAPAYPCPRDRRPSRVSPLVRSARESRRRDDASTIASRETRETRRRGSNAPREETPWSRPTNRRGPRGTRARSPRRRPRL